MSLRDVLLCLSVPLIWGLGLTLAKPAVGEFPPILLMTLRFALTAALLVWFVPVPRAIFRQIFVIALVSATMQYGLTFNGLRILDASTAALVVQLEGPFLALLGVLFLKERPSLLRLAGIAISVLGVAVIAGEPRLAGNGAGIALCAAGAFFWAAGQVLIRRVGAVGGFMLIAWVAVFATPQLLAASLVVEGNPLPALASASWRVWLAVAYMGVVMTALGYGIWYHLVGRHPLTHVAPFLLLLPLVTVTSSVLALGEEPTPWLLAGGVLVIAGVAAVVFERQPVPPPVAPTVERRTS